MTKKAKITQRHRGPAVIEAAEERPVDNDHGGWDIRVTLHYDDGGSQSIGGWHLDRSVAQEAIDEICRVFGVGRPRDLVGKRCFGLKELGEFNEHLCGIETENGKRFLLRQFFQKHYPDKIQKSRFEDQKERLLRDIAWAERQLADAHKALDELPLKFVDWENL